MNSKQIQIYDRIRSGFEEIINDRGLALDEIVITSRGLTPEEAIGITERKDYPILTGKEVMLQAGYKGSYGQAFTDAPAEYSCSIKDILALDIYNDEHARGLYIAAMNAVMKHLGIIDHTVHCRTKEPAECAQEYVPYLKEHYQDKKIALIGYQPSLFEAIAADSSFELRVLDLNPDNVGQVRFGHTVEHGINDYDEVVLKWADIVLCTSSVFANATMDRYIDIGKKVLFFGITGAGPIHILGLDRHCPKSV